MVDVSHNGDDRRPRLEVLRPVFLLLGHRLGVQRFFVYLEPEVGGDDRRGLVVDGFVDVCGDPVLQQLADDDGQPDAGPFGEFLHRQRCGQLDRSTRRDWCRRRGSAPLHNRGS
jgi:hypothetical protein